MAKKLFDICEGIKSSIPAARWQADPEHGTPVILVTGCSTTPFQEDKFVRTPTKAFFPGNETLLCNVSLPIALKIAEQGTRVIAQCTPSQVDTLRSAVLSLPYHQNITVMSANLGEVSLLEELEITLEKLAQKQPISRVDFVLYESYTADAARPFLPTWEENSDVLGDAIKRRVKFFQYVSNYAYDIINHRHQKELRVMALTALASFRPAAYLFADAAHKAVSSTFLQSWAREVTHYTRKVPIAILEICPGIVDTGLYDPLHVRQIALDKAERGNASFDAMVLIDNLATWPMISPWDIATIIAWYQHTPWNTDPKSVLTPELQRLLSAGRPTKYLQEQIQNAKQGIVNENIPLYAYYPGYPWGSMPTLKPGYSPVFITPPGQFV